MAQGRTLDSALRSGKAIWRNLAPRSLRSLAQPVVAHLAQRRVDIALSSLEAPHAPGPLVVSGLLSESKGVSEAARLTIAGLEAAGFSPTAHDLRRTLEIGPGAGGALPVTAPGGVWIVHVNAPEATHALAYLDAEAWRGRYRIGYWAYELPRIPASWVKAARAFHEIWAPSRFVADAIRDSGVSVPVRVMPHPVAAAPPGPKPDRARYGVPPDAFAVLAMGDLHSSATRKNLVGAIDIYRRAFPTDDGCARLVLKVQSSEAHPQFAAMASKASGGRSDIIFVTETLERSAMHALIASADVLLSPHRAEGFGLPLAEALLMGVPALATGWSGNADFMADLPELSIASRLVPVRDPSGIYRAPGLSWAEPDAGDAAAKLRALADSCELRVRLAAQGKRAVEAQLGAWSHAALMATALGPLVER
jgi:glycosyltransferase involved in cell wall biosynthesis